MRRMDFEEEEVKKVFVVVGGQFGSEGKGKVAAFLTQKNDVKICVRTGGPNAGHCFEMSDGRKYKLRQLPAGAVYAGTRVLIPAGALLSPKIFKAELALLGLDEARVGVDRNTMILENADAKNELEGKMYDSISSTQSGVGAATARRVMRGNDVRLAKDCPWLKRYITNVSLELLRSTGNILIEGTQGFGLSLYHSQFYPKATSRDTSAAGVISEAGISPLAITDIVMVVRTFPIRVAGMQAGPLFEETTWEEVRRASGYAQSIEERTTVTGRIRRVGAFDYEQVLDAIKVNQPTALAVNFLDYLDCQNRSCKSSRALTGLAADFCKNLSGDCQVSVRFGGTGPKVDDMVEF